MKGKRRLVDVKSSFFFRVRERENVFFSPFCVLFPLLPLFISSILPLINPASGAGMAFPSSEETDSSSAATTASPTTAPASFSSSSCSSSTAAAAARRSRTKQRRVPVPAAAIHATAAVLCARVHSELAYAPASRAPEAAHALCLALDAALRCKSVGGAGGEGGGEGGEGKPQARGKNSPSAAFSSSVSIAKVGAPTELPDAAFVAVALPVVSATTAATPENFEDGNSALSSSSEEERKNALASAHAAAAAAAAAAGDREQINTAPLVAALLRAAERLHAAVAQVRLCF